MPLPELPAVVVIRDVGPRDGLQPEQPVSVADRVRLIEALVAAGVRRIEAAAFVSPKAVPAMVGAAELMALVPRSSVVRYSALVPNVRGAQLALETDVDELTVTISLSETYNQRNVHRSTEDSALEIEKICRLAGEVPVDAVISCAFGSPYEGDLPPRQAAALANRLRESGCAAITCADTTGMATPRRIEDVLARVGNDVGLHLHDTRGTALVNAFAAMQLGVDRFDTSVGGLGGSPFASGAAGNLATEELVAMLDDVRVVTGIDVDGLVNAAALASELVGRPVPSRVALAGPRDRLSEAP
ncbi:MAG: hydroxymethylglutaryl-CoA lyase [Acidimicrobiales bacterium]|nr:hydroxymethylglutaryl-CoA lyase [Acidimicrobiales bacterium]